MIKLYLMLRIKNIVYSSFVFLLIKFQKSFIVKKKKNNKGVFGRVVWDKIFVIFSTFFEIHVGKKVCGNVCKCFWNVKIIAQIGIPNGP